MQDLNLIISQIFIVEIIIRVTASGFILGPNSYLRDGFNIFDFLIVSTISFTFLMDLMYDDDNSYGIDEIR